MGTLLEWLKPQNRLKATGWDVHSVRASAVNDIVTVLMQVVLGVKDQQDNKVTQKNLHFNNIRVQECEYNFWVHGIFIESMYTVVLSDVSGKAHKHTKATDFTAFYQALTELSSVSYDPQLLPQAESKHYYFAPINEFVTGLRAACGKGGSTPRCDKLLEYMLKYLHKHYPASMRRSTAQVYMEGLVSNFGKMRKPRRPRRTWCRVLEFWIQMVNHKCNFNSDGILAERIEPSAEYRLDAGGHVKTIPAHVRVHISDSCTADGFTDQVLNLLETLISTVNNPYVFKLMNDFSDSLRYELEISDRIISIEMLYEHWANANNKLLYTRQHTSIPELIPTAESTDADTASLVAARRDAAAAVRLATQNVHEAGNAATASKCFLHNIESTVSDDTESIVSQIIEEAITAVLTNSSNSTIIQLLWLAG